jgi:hypothetical protein
LKNIKPETLVVIFPFDFEFKKFIQAATEDFIAEVCLAGISGWTRNSTCRGSVFVWLAPSPQNATLLQPPVHMPVPTRDGNGQCWLLPTLFWLRYLGPALNGLLGRFVREAGFMFLRKFEPKPARLAIRTNRPLLAPATLSGYDEPGITKKLPSGASRDHVQ